jgi:hypothetical protein
MFGLNSQQGGLVQWMLNSVSMKHPVMSEKDPKPLEHYLGIHYDHLAGV